MIFGNLKMAENYCLVDEILEKCFNYVNGHDLLACETGSYEIDGQNLFVNIVEYDTQEENACFWEAHKKYIDVHVILEGQERIDVGFVSDMCCEEYDKERDYLPLKGNVKATVVLRKNDFLVCHPHDGHRTGVAVEKPERIRKAIFKVMIE